MHVQFLRDTIYPNQVINRLNQERLLLLGQGIDSEISNQLTSLMVYQSIEDVNWTAQEEIIGLLRTSKKMILRLVAISASSFLFSVFLLFLMKCPDEDIIYFLISVA